MSVLKLGDIHAWRAFEDHITFEGPSTVVLEVIAAPVAVLTIATGTHEGLPLLVDGYQAIEFTITGDLAQVTVEEGSSVFFRTRQPFSGGLEKSSLRKLTVIHEAIVSKQMLTPAQQKLRQVEQRAEVALERLNRAERAAAVRAERAAELEAEVARQDAAEAAAAAAAEKAEKEAAK